MGDNLLDKIYLDDVLAKLSVLGPYHAVSFAWLTLALLFETMCYSSFMFIAEEVRYSYEQNTTTAWCNSPMPCSQWIYEDPNSFVAEFQLACQEWKRTLVGTAHAAGYMLGIFFVGSLSDRFGRRNIAIVTGLTAAVFGLTKSFVSYYWIYIAIEFFEGAIADPYSPLYMLILEMVATGSRATFTSMSNAGLVLGGMSLALIKWLVPYWRTYTRVIYAPMVFYIFLIILVDESPRWLLTKGKKNTVVMNIENAAKLNKIEIKENLSTLSYEKETSSNFMAVIAKTFKSKSLLKRFFVCIIWWNTCTFVDHGLLINSVLLKGNRYVNYGVISFVRLPSALVSAILLNNYKRKGPLMLSFVACTVLCISHSFINQNQAWFGIAIYMASKLTSGMFFNITYIFTSELFPTYTRNSMHALCACLGRIGNIIATQMPLLAAYWSGLPVVIYGATSLVAALVTTLVPDTADVSLPDTVRQAEAIDSCKKGRTASF
ncbi:solute carrier family 22 member 1-like isoform X2 [Choristoneura fumiferana]|uniref:solute carrier family 22 member 1-like isoform X2 n=1 Tax=Choristoneura fumiferana TaxID=7141 RepID=UPI003D15E870